MMKEPRLSALSYIVFIVPIVIIAGISGASASALIFLTLEPIGEILLFSSRLSFLLPCIGALVTGALILRHAPGAGGEGTPLYLTAVNRDMGRLSIRDTLLKIPATLLTLGTYNSGGIVGPLMRIGSGISGYVADKMLLPFASLRDTGRRTAAICGAGAAIGAIFHAPLAAGLFAAEVLRREDLRYSDLLPSILAGLAGTLASVHIFGQDALIVIDAPRASGVIALMPWLLIAALVSGALGMAFLFIFERTATLLTKVPGGQPARALAGSICIAVIFFFAGKSALGASIPLLRSISTGQLSGAAPIQSVLGGAATMMIFLIVIKIVATSITVGSGMSGGLTGPLLIIGFASGALMNSLYGAAPGDPAYFTFCACAVPAILAAVMNIPIAAAALSIELFGPSYAVAAMTGSLVSFLLFRTRSIYGKHDIPYHPDARR